MKTAAELMTQAIVYISNKEKGNVLLSVLMCWLLQAPTKSFKGTAATDGVRVLVDEEFFDGLSVESRAFIFCHEALHAVFRHIPQLKGFVGDKFSSRLAQKSNIAQDMYINYVLGEAFGSVSNRFQLTKDGKPFGVYVDSKMPDGKPLLRDAHLFDPDTCDWYWIFQRLHEDAGGGDGDGFGDGCDLEPGDAEAEAQAEIQAGRAISQGVARQQQHQGYGKEGGWLERMCGSTAVAKHDWKSALWAAMQGSVPSEYSFKRLNKTYANMGCCVGSISRPGIGALVCAMDTSGSISAEMLMQPIAEVNAILQDVRPEKIYQLWIDADVANVQELEPDMPLDPDPKGGGGTDFRPAFEWADKCDNAVEFLIYFTDGYGSFPDKAPDYPVIWMVLPGGLDTEHFPFGKVVRMVA